MAHKAGYTAISSHRSGETADTTIADLAVAPVSYTHLDVYKRQDANIVKPEAGEADTTALKAAVEKAEALKEADYTADSWKARCV